MSSAGVSKPSAFRSRHSCRVFQLLDAMLVAEDDASGDLNTRRICRISQACCATPGLGARQTSASVRATSGAVISVNRLRIEELTAESAGRDGAPIGTLPSPVRLRLSVGDDECGRRRARKRREGLRRPYPMLRRSSRWGRSRRRGAWRAFQRPVAPALSLRPMAGNEFRPTLAAWPAV